MVQLIVNVKKLNKRKAVPATLPDPSGIIGIVEAGFTFEGTRIDPLEYPNPEMGNWYRDRDGYVYWGGGLAVADMPLLLEAAPEAVAYPWWLKNQSYSIPDLWDNDPNPNVRIAILDTGINPHVDFDFTKITGHNFITNTPDFKADIKGHGTHLAGMIAARGTHTTGVFPQTRLYIAKVSENAGTPSHQAVKNALQAIFDETQHAEEIDIINMSFHLSTPTQTADKPIMEDIRNLIRKLTSEKDCVIIGACGDHGPEFKAFPASMEECLSVGTVSSDFIRWADSSTDPSLDVMAPGVDIVSSSGQNASKKMSGTSQSSAFISGLCGLAAHEMKKKNGIKNGFLLKKTLLQTSLNSGFPPEEYGHGICNPNAFIHAVKNITL